jgi:hypothetical protein
MSEYYIQEWNIYWLKKHVFNEKYKPKLRENLYKKKYRLHFYEAMNLNLLCYVIYSDWLKSICLKWFLTIYIMDLKLNDSIIDI